MRDNEYNRSYDDLKVHDDVFQPAEVRSVSAANAFLNRVYGWMCLALALTGGTAWLVASQENLLKAVLKGWWLFLILELGLVIGLTAAIRKISPAAALIGFLAYSVVNGATLSFVLIAYTQESVAAAFFAASLTFGVTGLIGWFIKADLSVLHRLLMMSLIGLIIASVINLFLGSSGLQFLICVIGVLLFAALTAYDTQKIKRPAMVMGEEDASLAGKVAVIGALALYLDFINLFLYLLQLFGRRR